MMANLKGAARRVFARRRPLYSGDYTPDGKIDGSFRLQLRDVISAAAYRKIVYAKRMVFHLNGDMGGINYAVPQELVANGTEIDGSPHQYRPNTLGTSIRPGARPARVFFGLFLAVSFSVATAGPAAAGVCGTAAYCYRYDTIGAGTPGFSALGASNSFYVAGGAYAPHSNNGPPGSHQRARTIETTWFSMSDGGDSLIEVFAGVSGAGEYGLTRTTATLVLFVYYPGSGTSFSNYGAITLGHWYSVDIIRDTPSAWWFSLDGLQIGYVTGLGGGYISDVATGNETLLYKDEGFDLRLYGYTGVNPKWITVFGVWVNGYPGGWAVHETHSSPFFGTWYSGMWVNGIDGSGIG